MKDLILKVKKNKDALEQGDIFSYITLAEYELYHQHVSNGIDGDAYGLSDIDSGKFVRDITKYYVDHDTDCIIAKEADTSVGFVGYNRLNNNEIYIISLYVDVTSRRNGVASKLVNEVLKLKPSVCKALIADFNTESKGLFTKLGFKPTSESPINGMREYHLVLK